MSGARAEEVRRWLRGRSPAGIEPLSRRLDQAVADHAGLANTAGDVSEALATVALALLRDVTGRVPDAPGLALDLLAADALVTFAFEAAAECGRPIAPLAERVVSEIPV